MKFVTAPLPPTYFEQQQMLTFCKNKNFAKQDWFWCRNNCNSTLYFCGLNITLISTVYLSPHVFTIIHIFYQTLSICNKSVWTGDQFLEVEKCSWFRNSRMLASKTFFMDCWVLSKESIFWTQIIFILVPNMFLCYNVFLGAIFSPTRQMQCMYVFRQNCFFCRLWACFE